MNIYVSLSLSSTTGSEANFNLETDFIADVLKGSLQEQGTSGLQLASYGASAIEAFTGFSTAWEYSTLDTFVSSRLNYSGDVEDNNLKTGLETMIATFNSYSTADTSRVALILVNAFPGIPSSLRLSLCDQAVIMKELDDEIRVILVLIGTDTQDFDKRTLECLVINPTTDIIEVSNYSSLSSAVDSVLDLLCADYYQFTITEVKATNTGGTDAFVEIFNWGKVITASELTLTNLVAGTGPTSDCGQREYCSFDYADYTFAATNNTDWTVTIADVMTGTDTVTQSSIITVEDGFSYQLIYKAYYNKYAANWRQSCTNTGTSGAVNVVTCSPYSCSAPEDSCSLNGGSITGCTTSLVCLCTSLGEYFEQGPLCIPVPLPSNCIAYYQNIDGTNYVELRWSRAEYDGTVSYLVDYNSEIGKGASDNWLLITAASTTATAVNTYLQSSVSLILFESTTIDCSSTVTNIPTSIPTKEPTSVPTLLPTTVPTVSPTFSNPDYYFNVPGCSTRCGCAARYADVDTDGWSACCTTDGYENNASVCPKQYLSSISITDSHDTIVGINQFPSTFITRAVLKWSISLYNISSSSTTDDDDDNSTMSGTSSNATLVTLWEIDVEPRSGTLEFNNDSLTSTRLKSLSFVWSANELTDCGGDEDYAECNAYSETWLLKIDSCDVSGFVCSVDYPYEVYINVKRSDCDTVCPLSGSNADDIPMWIWWVLVALLIFLIILALLIYRFWWKGKKDKGDLADREIELDEQLERNDAGIGGDLDTGDVVFNPMATGVPGMNRPVDVFSQEVEQRKFNVQNDIADTKVEKFSMRQDFGQVQNVR